MATSVLSRLFSQKFHLSILFTFLQIRPTKNIWICFSHADEIQFHDDLANWISLFSLFYVYTNEIYVHEILKILYAIINRNANIYTYEHISSKLNTKFNAAGNDIKLISKMLWVICASYINEIIKKRF